MPVNKRIFIIPLLGILISLLLLSGCSRDNLQQSLSQKKLGIELNSEKGDSTLLNDALAAYLSQQLPDTKIIALDGTKPALNPDESKPGFGGAEIDYVLKVRLSEIEIKTSPNLDLSKSSLKLQLGRKCQLTLNYRLTHASTGQVVLRGQTQGMGESQGRLHMEGNKIEA